jgi:DNA helicase-2/ATP-dependent DNA helicase PcrA
MGVFEERYAKLNSEQKKAVDKIEGPVLVIAGPGSGKTELLSLRVAIILKDTDASAGSILCLTFTDAAALNMRERLAKLIGPEAYRVGIHTFHGFATSIIERYPEYFFGGALFSPADEVVQLETMRATFEALTHDHPLRSFHPEQGFVYSYDAKKGISDLKRAGISPKSFKKLLDKNESEFKALDKALAPFESKISKAFIDEANKIQKTISALAKGNIETLAWSISESLAKAIHESEILEKTAPLSDWKRKSMKKTDDGKLVLKERVYHDKLCGLALVYEKYQDKLHSEGYFDFGDMIMRLSEALENEPTLLYELQEKYQYILTDEFQDTNGAQMAIKTFNFCGCTRRSSKHTRRRRR